jgi:hypothetical protein
VLTGKGSLRKRFTVRLGMVIPASTECNTSPYAEAKTLQDFNTAVEKKTPGHDTVR